MILFIVLVQGNTALDDAIRGNEPVTEQYLESIGGIKKERNRYRNRWIVAFH